MSVTLNLKVISSLEKIFYDSQPVTSAYINECSILKNERYNFQIAVKIELPKQSGRIMLYPKVRGDLADCTSIFAVNNVLCELPAYGDHDENYLRTSKGAYPDVLEPVDFCHPVMACDTWRAVWIECSPAGKLSAGKHEFIIDFFDEDQLLLSTASHTIEIIDAELPDQELIFTQWFYGDCIRDYYGLDDRSDRHFEVMEAFIKTAADNGVNMLLTPVFTPPLETKINGDHPVMQLVDVTKSGEKYAFNFEHLQRYIDIAIKNGVKYFEISHLFTQWGAQCAPKIMATVNGVYQQLFGWETPAMSEEYTGFLSSFLPQLTGFLSDQNLLERTYFHVSDEPDISQMKSYSAAANFLKQHLAGCKMFDALSDYSFYETGLVPIPVPASDHMAPFITADISERWTYYCCAQGRGVSNRFIAMPSARNRIIATQLYKFDIDGFLHWGYNFWFSPHSRSVINPFVVTDTCMSFPSGDPFSVYPGPVGPLSSIRLKTFFEAICDLRAMKLLEMLTSKEHVLSIIENGIDPIEFDVYPEQADYILNMRNTINSEIAKNMQ